MNKIKIDVNKKISKTPEIEKYLGKLNESFRDKVFLKQLNNFTILSATGFPVASKTYINKNGKLRIKIINLYKRTKKI